MTRCVGQYRSPRPEIKGRGHACLSTLTPGGRGAKLRPPSRPFGREVVHAAAPSITHARLAHRVGSRCLGPPLRGADPAAPRPAAVHGRCGARGRGRGAGISPGPIRVGRVGAEAPGRGPPRAAMRGHGPRLVWGPSMRAGAPVLVGRSRLAGAAERVHRPGKRHGHGPALRRAGRARSPLRAGPGVAAMVGVHAARADSPGTAHDAAGTDQPSPGPRGHRVDDLQGPPARHRGRRTHRPLLADQERALPAVVRHRPWQAGDHRRGHGAAVQCAVLHDRLRGGPQPRRQDVPRGPPFQGPSHS